MEILAHITNNKHRLIISILYGSGLRVSEVCNLKIKDLDFTNLALKPKIPPKGYPLRSRDHNILYHSFSLPLTRRLYGAGSTCKAC